MSSPAAMPTTLAHTLALACAELQLPLAATTQAQLMQFLEELLKWNKVYNLTAIHAPQDALVQHLVDSLSALPALDRHFKGRPARIIDVGSGGGLPGVVWAIARPELQVHCVDAVAKKARFIQQCAASLRLPNLNAHHSRVERLDVPPFELISSRAFASLPDMVAWTERLLAPAGRWLAMKGHTPTDEIKALPEHIVAFHVEPLSVPGLDAQRCLVWLARQTEAP